ncbi:MAG: NADH-quinone oxidoreductase subunit [Dehalococcoidia bacterium]|nr:NADH-quinone oxidoreductase subunit [Dehalococcoidia bacterium]
MPILSTLLFLPFAGALVIMLLPGSLRRAIKWVAVVTSLGCLVLSLYVFLGYDHQAGGYQLLESYPWFPPLGISLILGVDGISAPMVLLTGIVIFTGVLMMCTLETRVKDFFFLLLVLVGGVYGTFMSLDLFFFFFFYELAVIPMYPLIGVWGSSTDFGVFLRTKEYGAMKLVLYLVAGSVPVWIALIAIYVQSGAGSFSLFELQKARFSLEFQNIFFPFVMIGFGVLAGLWPFHTWSPDGHVAAPTGVSMLHAGVLMKLGAYGIIRVGMTLMPEGAVTWMPFLLVLATINVLYGAVSAMAQGDLKYVVGYSSVSHMGYVLMGFGTLSVVGMNGAVLQMFSHGIMTALLFAVVGVLYDRSHIREIAKFGGLARRMGVVATFLMVAGLTSLGLPGLSGFVAEFLVFVGAFQTYPLVAVLGVIGAAITAVYILRLLATVLFGPLGEQWQHIRDASPLEGVSMAILVFVLVLVGLFPNSLMPIISSGVENLEKIVPLVKAG